jgi:hypothetical protein
MCDELKDRFEQFKRRSLYDVNLVAWFLDATFVSVRPSGPKEGVLVAWGSTSTSVFMRDPPRTRDQAAWPGKRRPRAAEVAR